MNHCSPVSSTLLVKEEVTRRFVVPLAALSIFMLMCEMGQGDWGN